MANISFSDRRLLDKLFVQNGYVLDFNNATFSEFFRSEIGVDIDDPRYAFKGTSKGNRFRAFLELDNDATVARALRLLLDYYQSSFAHEVLPDNWAPIEKTIAELSGLDSGSVSSNPTVTSSLDKQATANLPDIAVGTITALASYAHQSSAYDARVLKIVQRLNADGIGCISDHSVDFPKEGWPLWMEREIKARRWVLVFASEQYKRRADGDEFPDRGLGVIWEHGFIRSELYKAGRINDHFLPVGFGPAQRAFVPRDLTDYTYFDLDSGDDYQKLLRVMRGLPHPLVKTTERLAGQSLPSADDVASQYRLEDQGDGEFFGGWIPATTGQFWLKLRPLSYTGARLSRRQLADALELIHVRFTHGDGCADEIPFAEDTTVRGFGNGSGMEGSLIDAAGHRIERIRIHRSGQYAVSRVFAEDYGDDDVLKFDNLELWNEDFIRRLTLFFVLAALAAKVIGINEDDLFELKMRVTGLGNRSIVPSEVSVSERETSVLARAEKCFERMCDNRWILTRHDIEHDGVRLAREMICDIYWNFGLTDDAIAEYVTEIQSELLGREAGTLSD